MSINRMRCTFWFEGPSKEALKTLLELGPGIASSSRASSAAACLVGWGDEAALDLMKGCQKQVFIWKVVIQRAASHPRVGNYVMRAGSMITLRGEQPAGSLTRAAHAASGLVCAQMTFFRDRASKVLIQHALCMRVLTHMQSACEYTYRAHVKFITQGDRYGKRSRKHR